MKPLVASVAALALALLIVIGGAFGLAAFGSCSYDRVDPQQASRLPSIDGYSGDQLAYAAVILNTVAEADVDARAAAIAVTAAITRSDLRNLDTPPELGLFGLGEQFGSAAERLDPATATRRLLATLTAASDWTSVSPASAAAAAIPGTNATDYVGHYASAAAITSALQSTRGSCAVSENPIELAKELVEAADRGDLRGLVPDHVKQIRWIAQGEAVPDCGIDTRILQVLVIATRNFDLVTVSDINRKCTGELLGAGTGSAHWLGGGGHAVDFAALNGHAVDGADADSLRLIGLLDPLMPSGSRIGQVECRAAAGVSLVPQNFTQFYGDSCDHLHVDVYYAENEALSL